MKCHGGVGNLEPDVDVLGLGLDPVGAESPAGVPLWRRRSAGPTASLGAAGHITPEHVALEVPDGLHVLGAEGEPHTKALLDERVGLRLVPKRVGSKARCAASRRGNCSGTPSSGRTR